MVGVGVGVGVLQVHYLERVRELRRLRVHRGEGVVGELVVTDRASHQSRSRNTGVVVHRLHQSRIDQTGQTVADCNFHPRCTSSLHAPFLSSSVSSFAFAF